MTEAIRASLRPRCMLCGGTGQLLHQHLTDRMFGAPGKWDVMRCTNRDCGLLWPNPFPESEDLPLAYENYYTHGSVTSLGNSVFHRVYRSLKRGYIAGQYGYGASAAGIFQRSVGQLLRLFPIRRRYADEEARYLDRVKGGRVLDVGCGSGEWLVKMMQLGWECSGCDFDAAAIQLARERGVDARIGSLEALDFPNNSFDAITLNHVIEHLPDPIATLMACERLLNPGGSLFVATPNAESLSHRIFGAQWRGLEPPRHLAIFTPRALTLAVEESGFEVARREPQNADSVWHDSMLMRTESGNNRAEKGELPWLYFKATCWTIAMSILTAVRPDLADCIVLVAKKPSRAVAEEAHVLINAVAA
jgi:SAM-dependent methyltransferase